MTQKPKVATTQLPTGSLLHARVSGTDFLDCYAVPSKLSPRRAAEVITDFPGWAKFLLVIRRIMTTPFGLSNDGPGAENSIGIFPVESESPKELIAGFNDRHLDFRISIMQQDGRVFLATWVHPNNIGGWIYLKAILPFHILIARNGLTRVANQPLA